MRILDYQLNLLRLQKAQGSDVDEAIKTTLIAMIKDSYSRDEISIEQMESTIHAILHDEEITLVMPGEQILRRAE